MTQSPNLQSPNLPIASLQTLIVAMPKVELHVHLQGATQPETFLALAKRNGIQLPYDTVEGLRQWYSFRDFDHFIEIYMTICDCVRTPDDIELMAREFLKGQAAQNIKWSEVTYTAWLHRQIPWTDQLAAINRARAWAQVELGVDMGLIIDIPRIITAEEGLINADWAIDGYGNGVIAFGLGGPEVGNPAARYKAGFDRVRAAGVPCILHAGETVGPDSIWDAIHTANTLRIGHGVRCVEDPDLVTYLRESQIPLEVSPTSNVCLKVYPSLAQHTLPQLLAEGLYVTINSDDPPMFNTNLTNEWLVCTQTFGWDIDMLKKLNLNAIRASLLPAERKLQLESEFDRFVATGF